MEYKFRGKRIDNGEWVYGNLITTYDADKEFKTLIIPQTDNDMFTDGQNSDLGFERWHKVDPATIGQYTGIKDKNGVEIYEGDVLGKGNQKYEVKWGMGEPSFFALTSEKQFNCYSVSGIVTHGAIVIGNIHDKEATP